MGEPPSVYEEHGIKLDDGALGMFSEGVKTFTNRISTYLNLSKVHPDTTIQEVAIR